MATTSLPRASQGPQNGTDDRPSIICAAPPLLIWDMDWTCRGPRAKSVPKSLPNSVPSRPTIKLQVFDDPHTSVRPIRAKSVPDQTRIWAELARTDGAETP